jgi:hypothetical protein
MRTISGQPGQSRKSEEAPAGVPIASAAQIVTSGASRIDFVGQIPGVEMLQPRQEGNKTFRDRF